MKNIWLIGASEGIGKALAKELSLDNNNYLILSARNQESLHELSSTIKNSLVTYLDVSNAKSIKDSVAIVKNNNISASSRYLGLFFIAIGSAPLSFFLFKMKLMI